VRCDFLQRRLGRRAESLAGGIPDIVGKLDTPDPQAQQTDDVPGDFGGPHALAPGAIHPGRHPLDRTVTDDDLGDFIDAFPAHRDFGRFAKENGADVAFVSRLHHDRSALLERLDGALRKVIDAHLTHVGRGALRKRKIELDRQIWRREHAPCDGDLRYPPEGAHAAVSSKGSTMNGSTSCMNSWRPTRSRVPATSAGTIGTAGSRASLTDSKRLLPYTNGRP